jgi:hypothetical protein
MLSASLVAKSWHEAALGQDRQGSQLFVVENHRVVAWLATQHRHDAVVTRRCFAHDAGVARNLDADCSLGGCCVIVSHAIHRDQGVLRDSDWRDSSTHAPSGRAPHTHAPSCHTPVQHLRW